MPGELSGKAAIAGIGATDFSKDSGRSELRLAAEGMGPAMVRFHEWPELQRRWAEREVQP